jgi:hypothetical protein
VKLCCGDGHVARDQAEPVAAPARPVCPHSHNHHALSLSASISCHDLDAGSIMRGTPGVSALTACCADVHVLAGVGAACPGPHRVGPSLPWTRRMRRRHTPTPRASRKRPLAVLALLAGRTTPGLEGRPVRLVYLHGPGPLAGLTVPLCRGCCRPLCRFM